MQEIINMLKADQKASYTRRAARHAEQALEAMEEAIMELKKAVNFLVLSQKEELLQPFWNFRDCIGHTKTILRDTIKRI